MKDLKKLGELVREERVKHNLSLADLGRRLNLDRTLISKVENGRYSPTTNFLQRIIEVFSLDTDRANLLWHYSGKPVVFVETNNHKMENVAMSTPETRPVPVPAMNVSVNPAQTPVLYSDMMGVTSSEFGMVFDFGQRVNTTNNATIVARVGVSYDHARKIMEAIQNELARNER
jgi:transcriptional regulator with XRE-family HTH domain